MNKKTQNNLPAEKDYGLLREEFLTMLTGDRKMVYTSVSEAVECFEPAWDDVELAERLNNDPIVTRHFRRHIIQQKARLRGSMVRSAYEGNDKNAKQALSILADDNEWSRLSGKPYSGLALGGNGSGQQIVIVERKLTPAELKARLTNQTAVDVTPDAEQTPPKPQPPTHIDFDEDDGDEE